MLPWLQAAKVIEPKRAQVVGILLSSLRMEMNEIEHGKDGHRYVRINLLLSCRVGLDRLMHYQYKNYKTSIFSMPYNVFSMSLLILRRRSPRLS